MKQLPLIIFFLVSLTYGFSQNGADPFDLPTYSIKKNNIKTISELDAAENVVQHAVYDQHGNQIYYEEEDRIIQFELDYNQKGHLKKEVAIGLRHEFILKKRSIYNDLGQIDSIIYELPVGMYYSGFIEKYTYRKDGRIKNIDVYSAPYDRLMFQHNYVYSHGIKSELEAIRTFLLDGEESITVFTEKFTYYRNGNVKKSSQVSAKGDTIAINFFGEKGRLLNEITSPFLTTPSSYMYSSNLYSEVLKKIATPLTPFVICKNLNRENYQGKRKQLSHIKHEYQNGKLLKSIRSIKHKELEYILSTDTYRYNEENKLCERVTINSTNQDTTTVRFTSDQRQRYIHLSENSRSYLVVKKERNSENSSEELIIESFDHRWECKTTTDYDSIVNSVTKKKFCLDSEGEYPVEPEQITVAKFDSSGRQINHDTFFDAKKASKSTSYIYSDKEELVRYEYNGQYWKYFYNSSDSSLIRQEYYRDSLYENLELFYIYIYDNLGNYTVTLTYPNENDFSEYFPTIQYFDRDRKVLKKEWIAPESSNNQTMSIRYNNLGLCVEIILERWGGKEITRYKYDFY
ncbi:MAG: hypothetical protein HRT58_16100 [Crocinitomicaceae bacterium]|nr:hypothetical protein [Flavobacteriales bacterium]NQZ37192.1 hypothetical protein [Crocinitomicaceae bacterium]